MSADMPALAGGAMHDLDWRSVPHNVSYNEKTLPDELGGDESSGNGAFLACRPC
jgi:hypothetical protein